MADVVGGGTTNVTLYDEDGGLVQVVGGKLKVAAALADENGVAYSGENRLPVDIAGANITGTFAVEPSVQSVGNTPPGPVGANATFTGDWEDVLPYAAISVGIFTDAASTTNGAILQFSADGVNVLRQVAVSIFANTGVYFSLAPESRYVRVVYTNGPVAQMVLRVSVLYHYQAPAEIVQPFGATITDLSAATVVRAGLAGRIMSGGSTGAYAPLGTDGVGNLFTKEATASDKFRRALKFEPLAGEEIRRDETLTDDYHGIAPDGTAIDSTTWAVVRFYKTAGLTTRVRYRTGVAWDSRTAGWS